MLYICPTPIGNLEDITIRTLNTLKSVDEIYCEDTRHTINLLNHYDIKKPLFSLHEHNEKSKTSQIISKLKDGINIAYVSDAGMPGISDPGHILISAVIKEGVDFTVLPGATAFTVALVGSGLETDEFLFMGFLEKNKSKMTSQLIDIKKRKETIIIYESPHRIKSTLNLIYEVLGDRKVVLARELSKKFEQYIRLNISSLISKLEEDINIKGEMILVIEGGKQVEIISDEKILSSLQNAVSKGMSKKDSVKMVSEELSLPKNRVYDLSRFI